MYMSQWARKFKKVQGKIDFTKFFSKFFSVKSIFRRKIDFYKAKFAKNELDLLLKIEYYV